MSTNHATIPAARTEQPAPRVWLVAGLSTNPDPVDRPTVRDDLMRQWEAGRQVPHHGRPTPRQLDRVARTIRPGRGDLMITEAKQVVRSAVVSACGRYRYELGRTWGHSSVCGWIMLNPSTADGHQDDPTVRRCMAFARAWGYVTIVVRNLYALRATDPRTLWVHPQPVGEDNDAYLMESVEDDITVCAWGAQGRRGNAVMNALSDAGVNLHYLALTKAGVPRHPLYLPGHLRPVSFARGSAA